jgi:hypothetical protein
MSRFSARRFHIEGSHRARRPVMPRTAAGDSCGCALATKFLGIGLSGSVIWYAWPENRFGLTIGAVFLHILLWSFLAACLGKAVGMLRFSVRHQGPRLKTIRQRP